MKRNAFVVLLLTGCAAAEGPEHPRFLGLDALVALARAGEAAVAAPDGRTVLPMRALVTPPGDALFFRSPPFQAEETRNDEDAPLVNLLPAIAGGRFAPYITVELWKHDVGEVWVQPAWRLAPTDAQGRLQRDAAGRVVTQGRWILGVGVQHRFYSPFWRALYVAVPPERLASVGEPKRVKEVLDLGLPIIEGPLFVWPIVEERVLLDPGLRPAAPPADNPDGPPSRIPVPGLVGEILRAEYSDETLRRTLALQWVREFGWVEGRSVGALTGFGTGRFAELPGYVVEGNPVFQWVDRAPDGSLVPLGLPNVAGHGPLFSGRPLQDHGGAPDWSTFWDVVQVVRPSAAQPFFPGRTEAGGVDRFAALREAGGWPEPSPAVNRLPGVLRYAGRMAAAPACFLDATAGATVDPEAPGATVAWARSCRFLDAQDRIESAVTRDSIVPTDTRALCPIVLWAEPKP